MLVLKYFSRLQKVRTFWTKFARGALTNPVNCSMYYFLYRRSELQSRCAIWHLQIFLCGFLNHKYTSISTQDTSEPRSSCNNYFKSLKSEIRDAILETVPKWLG